MLEIDADDSSDAEDTETRLEDYDLETSLEEFKTSRGNTSYLQTVDPEGYSFLAYAIGVQLLYSPPVNAAYQEKKKLFPATALETQAEKVNEWLERSLRTTFESVFNIRDQKALSKVLTDAFMVQNQEFIQQELTKWRTPKYLHVLFQQTLTDKPTSGIQQCLGVFEAPLATYVENLDLSLAEFAPAQFLNFDHFLLAISNYIENFYKQKTLMRTNGKFALSSKWPDHAQGATPLEQRLITEANKHKGHAIHTVYDIPIAFKQTVFNDLINTEIARGEDAVVEIIEGKYRIKLTATKEDLDASSIGFLFDEKSKGLYVPCSHDKVIEEIEPRLDMKSFCLVFAQTLTELKSSMKIKLRRGTLEQQHTFEAKDIFSFLANLRLNTRDKRRRIRQAREEEERKTTHGEKFHAAWQLSTQPILALEKQEITSAGARNDMVINLETYGAIHTELETFRRDINHTLKSPWKISNSLITSWVRDILTRGTPHTFTIFPNNPELPPFYFENIPARFQKPFLRFLINLSYLLFGCETQRNPGSLITHQMTLDLIVFKKLSWSEAIANSAFSEKHGGGEMPMSIGKYIKGTDAKGKPIKGAGKAVPAARALQSHYGLFALKPWKYDGESASESPNNEESKSINELLRRENAIVKKWLEHFEMQDKTITEQIQAIQNRSKNYWYPTPAPNPTKIAPQ